MSIDFMRDPLIEIYIELWTDSIVSTRVFKQLVIVIRVIAVKCPQKQLRNTTPNACEIICSLKGNVKTIMAPKAAANSPASFAR